MHSASSWVWRSYWPSPRSLFPRPSHRRPGRSRCRSPARARSRATASTAAAPSATSDDRRLLAGLRRRAGLRPGPQAALHHHPGLRFGERGSRARLRLRSLDRRVHRRAGVLRHRDAAQPIHDRRLPRRSESLRRAGLARCRPARRHDEPRQRPPPTTSGVDRVEFKVRGVVVATDTTAPFTANFDTKTVADGAAPVVATAVDTSGLSASTSTVNVTIDNTKPGAHRRRPERGDLRPRHDPELDDRARPTRPPACSRSAAASSRPARP